MTYGVIVTTSRQNFAITRREICLKCNCYYVHDLCLKEVASGTSKWCSFCQMLESGDKQGKTYYQSFEE